MDRSAAEDAVALYERALSIAADPSLRGRVLLARAQAHEASTAYAAALADIDGALALAHESGDRRLEMAALRARGGDPPIGLRLPMGDVERDLEAGLRLATGLGDRVAEADFNGRLTIIGSSRLQLATTLSRAELSLARSRASASPEAVQLALDGLKNVLSYLGDVERLRDVVTELAPPLRERESRWLLQWTVFESAFVAASDRDWDTARALVGEALEINARSGFTAYAGYFRAHLGWFERLAGDLDAALFQGRRGVAATSPVEHPWWYATAAGLLASTLVELGATGEAAELARRGLDAAGPAAPEAWRLRCLAPLALVAEGGPGDAAYAEASALLAGIECPPGHAWVNGADCYLLLARSARLRGDHAAATQMLRPLREAVGVTWGAIREQVEQELAQSSSATS
jgi:tetratricopeptide (TPR) repeat protein